MPLRATDTVYAPKVCLFVPIATIASSLYRLKPVHDGWIFLAGQMGIGAAAAFGVGQAPNPSVQSASS
jgi:hypothetical protein